MKLGTQTRCAIINADDYGFSPLISEGILQAHRLGVLTSTTITANMPAAEAAVRRLAEAPELGVGVHLNVCQGPVLSDAGKALLNAGGVMDRKAAKLILACIAHPSLLEAIEAECEAQIRWVLDHGIRPTHLDSHRHVHAFTPVFVRVAALARRYDIPFVRWPREVLGPGPWPKASAGQRRTARLLNIFCGLNARVDGGLRATAGTWGIAHTGAISGELLTLFAQRLGRGVTEIMTHPGAGDDSPAQTRLRESRAQELAALCDPRVKAAFQENNIQLVHYGRLKNIGG